jgi:sulfur-oxidizing protein SoxY
MLSTPVFLPDSTARRDALRHVLTVAAGLAACGLRPEWAWAQTPAGSEWNRAAFEAKSQAEVMKALGAAAPADTRDITLTAPDIAENGALVPLGISTTLTGVRRIAVLVDKNPSMLAAVFQFTDAVEPNLTTRIKMNQSSWVYAVAFMADGRTLFARRDVKITLGGCGA